MAARRLGFAADRGHPEACWWLGRELKKDPRAAALAQRYLETAAAAGIREARELLAERTSAPAPHPASSP